ncbi:MAG: Rnf-Nqr domain containing protein [Pseudomonadota bacterium]
MAEYDPRDYDDQNLFFGRDSRIELTPAEPISNKPGQSLQLANGTSVQLLSLTPLLALSVDTITALCLTMMQFALFLPLLSVRRLIVRLPTMWIRIPLLLFVLSCLVGSLELLVLAWSVPLAEHMGIYLPLLACSSVMLASVETCVGSKDTFRTSVEEIVALLGWGVVAVSLGASRELLGTGALLTESALLTSIGSGIGGLGDLIHPLQVLSFEPLRALVTPAGGLLAFGLLLAGIQRRRLGRQES